MNRSFDQDFIHRIDSLLKKQLKESRYRHTTGVLKSALKLAERYGVNPEKTAVAALLHDYAKDFSIEKLNECIKQYQIEIDPILQEAHQLLHGKVAAAIARHKLNIEDTDVLRAIENHTTGRLHMSDLEKIIYLSDFIEPGRDYPGVSELRALAEEDLDKAVYKALNNTMIYVLRTSKLLHPQTLEARNQMLLIIQEKQRKERNNGKVG